MDRVLTTSKKTFSTAEGSPEGGEVMRKDQDERRECEVVEE